MDVCPLCDRWCSQSTAVEAPCAKGRRYRCHKREPFKGTRELPHTLTPVERARAEGRTLHWAKPEAALSPTETRGKHVKVSLDRDTLRRAETFTLCEGATGAREDRGLGFRITESKYIVVARQRDVTLIEWGTSAAMRLSSDEQRSTLRAWQRAPESVRGKLCVQARGQRGRLPERDSPLWGDGEWVRQTAAIRDAHTAVETARFALDCAVSEHSNALDDVSVGAVTAAMVRSAERAAERARLSLDNALDALARCEGAYLATMAEQLRDRDDADKAQVARELKRQASKVNPDKAIAPTNTRSHKGKGRPMPTVQQGDRGIVRR